MIPGWITKHTGGAELQAHLIAEELIKRGWKIEVVTIGTKNDDDLRKSKYFNSDISYYYYKKHKFAFVDWFFVFFALLKTKSDVYYQRTIAVNTGVTAFYCKLFSKKMLFAIAHDDDVKKDFYKRTFSEINLSGFHKKVVKWLDWRFLNFWNAYGLKKSGGIIAQTNFQKEQLESNYGLNSILIRNSYDPAVENTSSAKENIVLWVGNMRTFKRAELFPEIVSKIENPAWKFVMIGRTYPQVEEKIASFSRDNFYYLGHLPYNETEDYFRKAKVLVSTSTAEGFSNTFIHAWLNETLIVSLNVNPDGLFDNAEIGYTFNDSFDEFIEKLKAILNDYDSEGLIVKRARRFVTEELSLSTNVGKLEGYINELK